MISKQHFNFRYEWIELFNLFTKEDIIDVMYTIEMYNKASDIDNAPEAHTTEARILFSLLKDDLVNEKTKYDKRLSINKANGKYGYLGGRPKNNKESINPLNNEN